MVYLQFSFNYTNYLNRSTIFDNNTNFYHFADTMLWQIIYVPQMPWWMRISFIRSKLIERTHLYRMSHPTKNQNQMYKMQNFFWNGNYLNIDLIVIWFKFILITFLFSTRVWIAIYSMATKGNSTIVEVVGLAE